MRHNVKEKFTWLSNFAVLGNKYVTTQPIELAMKTGKAIKSGGGDFAIKDQNGNVVAQIKGQSISMRNTRKIYDAEGNVMVTLHEKKLTSRATWSAFRGDSTKDVDKLCEFKIQKRDVDDIDAIWFGRLDAMLPHTKISGGVNNQEYKVKGRMALLFRKTLAKVSRTFTLPTGAGQGPRAAEQDAYAITISKGVDYAFVLAAAIAADEIYNPGSH